ncbi:MAG: hypothetical protein H6R14_304 [Proteobacteria bacterium]|nr:hypothetical protein [Pseudomonadota bacterium]
MQSSRRNCLKAIAAVAACSLSPALLAAETRHLLPGQVFSGSRVIQRPTEGGFPDLRTGGMGPPTPFVFPVSVAVTPTRDIYVADAGLGAIFRIDPMLDAMNAIRGARVTQQTRLAAASDGSLIVANGSAGPVLRIGRSGRILQNIDAQLGGGSYYDEVVADAASGRYYGLDKVQRRLEEVMPNGLGGMLLPERMVPEQPTAMAMDGQKIYIAGRSCQCLAAIDVFGARSMEIVAEDIALAIALAAGDGWLAVADARERQIKLWRQGALLAEADFAGLGLMDPRGLAIAQQTLYVADGAGRRVVSFRLRA